MRLSNTISDSVSVRTYKVDEKVSGLTVITYLKLKLAPLTIKLQYRYGENISDLLSISGFAVKDLADPITGEFSYTPLKNSTIWGEIHTNGKTFQAGIFGGILTNKGTKEKMSSELNPVYGLGTNIETLIRISPRVIYNSGKFRVAFELEYTLAAYGSQYDNYYVPATTTTVTNIRGLLATYYFF